MMKKIFVLSMMLTVMMAAQAQLKVAPKMAKGTTKVYVSESTTAIPGQKDVHTTSETKFTVTAENADGYTMEIVTTDVKSDATGDNLAAKESDEGTVRPLDDQQGRPGEEHPELRRTEAEDRRTEQ